MWTMWRQTKLRVNRRCLLISTVWWWWWLPYEKYYKQLRTLSIWLTALGRLALRPLKRQSSIKSRLYYCAVPAAGVCLLRTELLAYVYCLLGVVDMCSKYIRVGLFLANYRRYLGAHTLCAYVHTRCFMCPKRCCALDYTGDDGIYCTLGRPATW